MNPTHLCVGLCLRSTATRKGDPSALASSRDTSPRAVRGIGHHDKIPVHVQSLPDVQRSHMCAVFPWPRMHLCMTHQEPVSAQAVQVFNRLSLCPMGDRCQEQAGQQGAFRPGTNMPQGVQNVKSFGLESGFPFSCPDTRNAAFLPHT
jgi:hypothetical protein